VKYASRVKCAAAREGIYFISHCDQREQYFTISARKLFHIRRKANISLEQTSGLCYNDVRKAVPPRTYKPNDAWLRHILRQTSHHYETQWSNIIFAKQMHLIAAGDVSFDKKPLFFFFIHFHLLNC
jgi:hypothetical protein